MSVETEGQQFTFQAEIKQLLHLLAHSLYQSREIALRELISNASDALDKMRHVALTDPSRRDDLPLEIVVEGRTAEHELSIRDDGVGMTREELVSNLGTIAHSGSREFLRNLSWDAKADLSLIGQFGVGFYAAFMIADRVRVRTRSDLDDQGWEWESDGSGTFSIRPGDDLARGTEVVLHLKEDAREFADDWKIKAAIRRYSSFVPHPIRVGGEIVNDQKPIWVEPKSQVTDEQHATFFQHLTHRVDESPLWQVHLAADSPIQFRAILYCPKTNVERLGFGRQEHGLQLCARRVLVQAECRELLPEYLRFLYGLVDSEDLPLNVSRETLQDNTVIRRIRGSLVKAVIDRMIALADDRPAGYPAFFDQFGPHLKEGIATDPANRERLAKLLRFASSRSDSDSPTTSLDDYLGRAPADQDRIYYLGGPDPSALRKSPNLEVFRKRGLEVLFLGEPVDEFVMTALGSYQGKALTSIDSDDLGLPGAEPEPPAEATPETTGDLGRVLTLFREALGVRVAEVRESKRLTESPCCLVNAGGGPSVQMQRLLKMANQESPDARRILEINPRAPLIQRLVSLAINRDHDPFVRECALQLWSNAMILEGALSEPEAMVARVQDLMEQAAKSRSPLLL